MHFPRIKIERRDNGWLWTVEHSYANKEEGVREDPGPLVLKFWSHTPHVGGDFVLTLQEDQKDETR